jgi:hypothetical protein
LTARAAPLAAALLAVAGCATPGGAYEAVEQRTYPTRQEAPAECLAAAREARFWCRPERTRIDGDAQRNCTGAQWAYSRYC